MTQIIESLQAWAPIRQEIAEKKLTLGFTPTMGNLHAGHLSLMQRAKKENAVSVISIFVNPTQFNSPDDFKSYPRTLEQDKTVAAEAKVDYILLPQYAELYPDGYTYKINEAKLSQPLEGAFRPGHFEGMLTVVLKLLLITKPHRAYFGEKDWQQLELVKGLVKAFFLETEIVGCPTLRNEFGLPHSSRNSLLTAQEYEQAKWFSKIFHSNKTCDEIKNELTQHGFVVDYIADYKERRLGAVKLGAIRLIDNILREVN